MYDNNAVTKIIAGGVSSGAGVALLPATSGNSIGTILAFSAITIGVVGLVSQATVYFVRRYYQAK